MMMVWCLVFIGIYACLPDTTLPPLQNAETLYPERTDGPFCVPEDFTTIDPDTFLAHFIDVGQGDAIWLQLPSGDPTDPVDILIDAGNAPAFSGGEAADGGAVIQDYLTAHDMNPGEVIEWLIVTHGDSDHFGGIPTVLDAYNVGGFIGSGHANPSSSWASVRADISAAVAANGGVFASPPYPGLVQNPGDVAISTPYSEVRILWPHSQSTGGLSSNEHGLVIKVTVHDVSLLLTADIGESTELDLVSMHDNGVISLESELLKVPHHGSSNSNTDAFLQRVFFNIPPEDRRAVIMSGMKSFGGVTLPTTEVLDKVHSMVGYGRQLSTQHEDGSKEHGTEHDDDHILFTVSPTGVTRLCYHPSGTLPRVEQNDDDE
tara:strand:+ start:3214 stop:4338 length:1125 start_codon:yes stop_codon:yes gene_type:complete